MRRANTVVPRKSSSSPGCRRSRYTPRDGQSCLFCKSVQKRARQVHLLLTIRVIVLVGVISYILSSFLFRVHLVKGAGIWAIMSAGGQGITLFYILPQPSPSELAVAYNQRVVKNVACGILANFGFRCSFSIWLLHCLKWRAANLNISHLGIPELTPCLQWRIRQCSAHS